MKFSRMIVKLSAKMAPDHMVWCHLTLLINETILLMSNDGCLCKRHFSLSMGSEFVQCDWLIKVRVSPEEQRKLGIVRVDFYNNRRGAASNGSPCHFESYSIWDEEWFIKMYRLVLVSICSSLGIKTIDIRQRCISTCPVLLQLTCILPLLIASQQTPP